MSWFQQGKPIYHHPGGLPWSRPYLPLGRAPTLVRGVFRKVRQHPFAFPGYVHISDLGLHLDPWLLTSGLALVPCIQEMPRGAWPPPASPACCGSSRPGVQHWSCSRPSRVDCCIIKRKELGIQPSGQAKAIWMSGKRKDVESISCLDTSVIPRTGWGEV